MCFGIASDRTFLLGASLGSVGPYLTPVGIIASALAVYEVIVLAAAVMSWFQPNPCHPLVRLVRRMTDPLFRWLGRVLPLRFKGFDFAPLVALIAIEFIRQFLLRR